MSFKSNLAGVTTLLFLATLVRAQEPCRTTADCAAGSECHISYSAAHVAEGGVCFAPQRGGGGGGGVATAPAMVLLEEADPALESGMKVSSLAVQAPEGHEARVLLGSGSASPYSLGVRADGSFAIAQGAHDVLTVNKQGDVFARTKLLAAGSLRADDGFLVNDVSQWALAAFEDFAPADGGDASVVAAGWTLGETTQCKAGLYVLGGYRVLSRLSTQKQFAGLPKHNRVRVKATYHFIDLWQGETGWMKLSSGASGAMEYGWTDRYDAGDTSELLDVCGNPKVGEGHFSAAIDITLVHASETLDIQFGSTLHDVSPDVASFGISSVEVYVRTVH